ncbi:unnamed protein product, partial [marine sediment metagenome]
LKQTIAYIKDPPENKSVVGRPSLYWQVMPNDYILFSDTSEYEIKIVDPDGSLIKKISRKYVPIGYTDEEKVKRKKKQPPGRPIEFKKHKPAISWLLLSDQGYLLVRTLENPENDARRYHDIFDPQGRYLAKILLDGTLPRLWMQDKLYYIEEDDEGFPVVKRYKIKNWDKIKVEI